MQTLMRQLYNLLWLLLLATATRLLRLRLGLGSQISWGDLDVNLGRLRLWTCKLRRNHACKEILKTRRELWRHESRDTLSSRLTRLMLRS